MVHFKVNKKDIFFILKNQLNYGNLCLLDRYSELTEEALDMVVNEALDFAMRATAPLQSIGEEWGVRFENNRVSSPLEFKKAFKEYGRQGWTAACRNIKYGGQSGISTYNGIQSLDLMGRKMRIDGGAPFNAYTTELKNFS